MTCQGPTQFVSARLGLSMAVVQSAAISKMYPPEGSMFKTNPAPLKELLDDAESGKIQLPDFQRGWVWDDDRIRMLLASISRGFPVGAIMTLEAGGEIRLKSRMIEVAEGKDGTTLDAFLLDGQQRLTSMYQSLRHEGPVDTHDNRGRRIKRWYYIDMLAAMDPNGDREDAIVSVPEDKKETRNFGREVIRDLSSRELEYEQHMVLCRLEGRPPRLDLELYPYLLRVRVSTTSAGDYMTLLSGRAA